MHGALHTVGTCLSLVRPKANSETRTPMQEVFSRGDPGKTQGGRERRSETENGRQLHREGKQAGEAEPDPCGDQWKAA